MHPPSGELLTDAQPLIAQDDHAGGVDQPIDLDDIDVGQRGRLCGRGAWRRPAGTRTGAAAQLGQIGRVNREGNVLSNTPSTLRCSDVRSAQIVTV